MPWYWEIFIIAELPFVGALAMLSLVVVACRLMAARSEARDTPFAAGQVALVLFSPLLGTLAVAALVRSTDLSWLGLAATFGATAGLAIALLCARQIGVLAQRRGSTQSQVLGADRRLVTDGSGVASVDRRAQAAPPRRQQ